MRSRPASARGLALEPLESRAMLSATVEGLDATGFIPDIVVCPFPVIINGPGDTGAPRFPIDPLIIDEPFDFNGALFEEYNTFLVDHPDWLSDHGADGIQLQVMTESAYVSGLFLSNPGTARAFDAWIEQTYLMVDGENPFVGTGDPWPVIGELVIDGPCPFVDEPSIDGPCPVFDGQRSSTGTNDRVLAFATIADDASGSDNRWMAQAVAFSPDQSAAAAVPARPKRGVVAPIIRG